MAKIVNCENIDPSGIAMLEAAGHTVIHCDRNADLINKEIVDADAVITRIWEIDKPLLDRAKNLKIVSKHGVGYDNIDIDYCKEIGVPVTLALESNSESVAEHTFGLMMALAKNTIPVLEDYRDNGFSAKNHVPGIELEGKTVGIIGLGAIGKRFARMAALGFNMNVVFYDPYLTTWPEYCTRYESLEEMLPLCDVVTLHCLLSKETTRIMNAERLALLKKGCILLNCARGPMIDEPAMIAALQSGQLGGAGLDVTDPEPVDPDSVMFKMPNVLLTPHYAPTTFESAIKCSTITCQNIIDMLEGKEVAGRLV